MNTTTKQGTPHLTGAMFQIEAAFYVGIRISIPLDDEQQSKLTVTGDTQAEAVARLIDALDSMEFGGTVTVMDGSHRFTKLFLDMSEFYNLEDGAPYGEE